MAFQFKIEHCTTVKEFGSVNKAIKAAKEVNDQSSVRIEVSNMIGDAVFTITEDGTASRC